MRALYGFVASDRQATINTRAACLDADDVAAAPA